MKKAIIGLSVIIFLVMFFSIDLRANYPISIGPYIGLKGGVNASDVPWLNYNGFAFSELPEMGVSTYIPFTKDVFFGGGLNFSYSTYGFLMRYNSGNNEVNTTHQYNYFSISPYLYAKGFILGMNIGIPLGGTHDDKFGTRELKSDDLAVLADLKIGGIITVFDNEIGRFNILIEGSYAFPGLLNENYLDDDGNEYNYHPAQLWFGINYMFNLQKPVAAE